MVTLPGFCAPHPIPPLPGHLVDQTMRFHPAEVALDGRAAGTGQDFGHQGRDKGSFGQHGTQGRWRLARECAHLGFSARGPCLDVVEVFHRGQTCGLHFLEPPCQKLGRCET